MAGQRQQEQGEATFLLMFPTTFSTSHTAIFTPSWSLLPWAAQSPLPRSCSVKGTQQRFWGAKQGKAAHVLTLMEWGGGSACPPLTPEPRTYSPRAGKGELLHILQTTVCILRTTVISGLGGKGRLLSA